MTPKFPEEFDVFTVPHSRMKHLIKMCSNRLSTTDFSSRPAVAALLDALLDIFREFRRHEQIENRLIVERLQRRLSVRDARRPAVCDCHRDNRLTEMLELLEAGLSGPYRSEVERDGYRLRLCRAVDDFTGRFVPHMEEEERVFQPLLMEYFDHDELKELKRHVLENHSLGEKEDLPEKTQELPLPDLPSEVLTHVFSFLPPPARAASAAVCRRWREAALAPSLWRSLYPALWARGVWDPAEVDVVDELMSRSELQKQKDLDADEDEDDPVSFAERRLISRLTNHTLPLVGRHVRRLVLAGSRGLDSRTLRRLLCLCPGVRHLDVSYTSVGDIALKRLPAASLRCLEHADFSGCERLTDLALERLAAQLEPAGGGGAACDACPAWPDSGSDGASDGAESADEPGGAGARLRHLALSGCWRLTPRGLLRLAACPAAAWLRHLDASGCAAVGGGALRALAAAAPRLPPERLWYCDAIDDGPHPERANGCDNVECPMRHCCRN